MVQLLSDVETFGGSVVTASGTREQGGANRSAMRANMRVAFEGVVTKTARNSEPAMEALLFTTSVLLVNRHTMQIQFISDGWRATSPSKDGTK